MALLHINPSDPQAKIFLLFSKTLGFDALKGLVANREMFPISNKMPPNGKLGLSPIFGSS